MIKMIDKDPTVARHSMGGDTVGGGSSVVLGSSVEDSSAGLQACTVMPISSSFVSSEPSWRMYDSLGHYESIWNCDIQS